MDERIAAKLRTKEFRGDHETDVTLALGEIPPRTTVETLLVLARGAMNANQLEAADEVVLQVVNAARVVEQEG